MERSISLNRLDALPKRLVILIITLSIAPFILMLLGVDFGIQGKFPDSQEYDSGIGIETLFSAMSGALLHTILEWTAFCAALFTVILAYVFFRTGTDTTIPIIAVALFCAGCLDAFHTLAAGRLIHAVADNKELVPFTWAISRTFNALIITVGVCLVLIKPMRLKEKGVKDTTIIKYCALGFILMAYLIIQYCATSNSLPTTIFPDSIITRPWDVAPLFIYLILFFILLPKYNNVYPGLFAQSLLLSMVPEIATEMHMAFGSAALYDSHFNVAHFLKIIAYLTPMLGLLLEYMNSNLKQLQLAEELSASEYLGRIIFDNAPIGVTLAGIDGAWLRVNKSFADMLGYTEDELLEIDFRAITHADDIENDLNVFDNFIISDQETVNLEKRFIHKNGSHIWTRLHATKIKNEKDKVEYFTTQIENISEEMIARNELKSVQGQTQAIIDNAPAIITLKDKKGRYVLSNNKLKDVQVNSDEKVSGKTMKEVLPTDFAERVEEIQKQVVERGEAISQHLPYKDRHHFTNMFPIFDSRGEVTHIGNISLDVTEQYETEKALEESEERFDLAMRASQDGIFDSNLVTGETWYSDNLWLMMGYDHVAFELDHNSFFEKFIHPDDREYVADSFRNHLQVKANLQYECRIRHKSGSYLWCSTKADSQRDLDDKVVRIFGTVSDITARKTAEEELREHAAELQRSNRELEQFAYVASHDLQEPLRMVASFTELLAKRYEDKLDERANEYISFAIDGAKRMQTLINDLLQFSRLGSEKREFEPVDCNSLYKNATNSLSMVITESEAILNCEELPVISGDKVQLEQLFQNLIGNALKYRNADKKPVIDVGVIEKKTHWLFSVKDNGIGIKEEFFERIFIIFQRLHGKTEYSGTGIGLAICKKIVEHHHGSIWVKANDDVGSTFYFTLSKN